MPAPFLFASCPCLLGEAVRAVSVLIQQQCGRNTYRDLRSRVTADPHSLFQSGSRAGAVPTEVLAVWALEKPGELAGLVEGELIGAHWQWKF